MTIDRRSIAEWYPQAELRHRLLYAFAHQFLPGLAFGQSTGALIDRFKRQPEWAPVLMASLWKSMTGMHGLEPTLGIISPGRLDLGEGRANVAEGLTARVIEGPPAVGLLVRLPTPEASPQAAMALIAESNRGGAGWPSFPAAYRYFALEFTDARSNPADAREGPLGVICEWTADGTHHNYGRGLPLHGSGVESAFIDACGALISQVGQNPTISSRADPDDPRSRIYTIARTEADAPPDRQMLQ